MNFTSIFTITISLFFTSLIIFFCRSIGKYLNIIDHPKKNSIHERPVSAIGGIAFFTTIFIYLIINEYDEVNIVEIYIIFFIFLIGYLDDRYNLSPYLRLFFITILCLILIKFNSIYLLTKLDFQNFYFKSVFLEEFSIPFTIFCFLILYNAYNFTDGINGLAIIIALIWIIFLPADDLSFKILFISNLLLLLFFNLKGKIFLGNSGSLLISFFLAMQYIKAYNQETGLKADQIFIYFIIPGFDLIRLICSRILTKKSPMKGDMDHLHHLLIKKYSLTISLIIYSVILLFPILAFNLLGIKFVHVLLLSAIIYLLVILKLKTA
jgi:UDP-GlcNAc:undecaprenyl-phosphate/decaprenyl-phosphate GlcNAc-1-phosphate transferase